VARNDRGCRLPRQNEPDTQHSKLASGVGKTRPVKCPGSVPLPVTLRSVTGLLIGYARVSTEAQDPTAQRDGLLALGVSTDRVYVDHGLTKRGQRPIVTSHSRASLRWRSRRSAVLWSLRCVYLNPIRASSGHTDHDLFTGERLR